MSQNIHDPYAGFIEEGLAAQALNPHVESRFIKDLTPKERGMIAKIIDLARPKPVHSMTGTFLLYRSFMADRIKERLTRGVRADAGLLRDVMLQSWQAFIPHWVGLGALSLGQGYRDGIRAAAVGDVPDELTYEVAQGYAKLLGEEINATSMDAMMSGYQAQINRKVPPALAAKRVATAFGVPPRVMNGLVSLWLRPDAENLTDRVPEDVKKRQADQIINRAIAERAGLIGDTEVFTAKSQGQQLAWSRASKLGLVPKSARRVWYTANDERVCPVCGPMHNKSTPVEGLFLVAGKQVWTPPMHPNCRCTVKLTLRKLRPVSKGAVTTVRKAQGTDPFARDAQGRFSSSESRRNKPVKTKPVNPHTRQEEDLARQLEAYEADETTRPVITQVKIPFVSLGIDVNQLLADSQARVAREDSLKIPNLEIGNVAIGVPVGVEIAESRVGAAIPGVRIGAKMSIEAYNKLQDRKIYVPNMVMIHPVQVPIETPSGQKWDLLNDELVALYPPSEETFIQGGTVHIPQSRTLLVGNMVGDDQMRVEVSDYWLQFADRAVDNYQDQIDREGRTAMTFTQDGIDWAVTVKDFRQVMDAEIEGRAREGATVLHGVDRDGRVIQRAYANNIISRDMMIADLVDANAPTIIQMVHSLPGSTDIRWHTRRNHVTHAYNGGNWKVDSIELSQHAGGLVRMAFLIPEGHEDAPDTDTGTIGGWYHD